MYGDKRLLGLILARGGSKAIPGKNLAPVAGRPLIAWSIECGLASRHLDRLIVSTDSDDIADVARQWGAEVPFMRPASLAGDEATSAAGALHAVEAVGEDYDYVVLLQPTSPMRAVGDIDGAIEKCVDAGAASCATVCEATESPWRAYVLDNADVMHPVIPQGKIERRQDLEVAYVPNGAVFVASVQHLAHTMQFYNDGTLAYVMPRERSLDVDTPFDLQLIRLLMERQVD